MMDQFCGQAKSRAHLISSAKFYERTEGQPGRTREAFTNLIRHDIAA